MARSAAYCRITRILLIGTALSATALGAEGTGVTEEQQLRPDASLAHNHEGFYAQLAMGAGYGWYRSRYEGQSERLSLKFGGNVAKHWVLGGGTALTVMTPSDAGDSQFVSAASAELTLFTTYYPWTESSLHVTGILGMGLLNGEYGDSGDKGKGLVSGAALGYEFWVASAWSLGPELALTYVEAQDDYGSFPLGTVVLSLAVTYH